MLTIAEGTISNQVRIMACQIRYKQRFVQLNNMLFSRLVDFAIEVAERSAISDEHPYLDKMKQMRDHEFWPGRGIEIVRDFPHVAERMFWSRVFLDLSRAIFDRQVGEHSHKFWQAQTIHLAYDAGMVFLEAVREDAPEWFPDTLDGREYDSWVKQIDKPAKINWWRELFSW